MALALGLLRTQMMPAQGTLYLSNLGETSGGYVAVGNDSWVAAIFRAGTNPIGYQLNSVQLLTGTASGNPNGFAVSIYNDVAGKPGSSLTSLSGPEPTLGGLFTFSASGIMLSPSTLYFVVVTGATPVVDGAYSWIRATTAQYASSEGWFLGAGYFSSSEGSSWGLHRPFPFQFAVNATVVPEPATFALVGLGLVGLSFCRSNSRQAK